VGRFIGWSTRGGVYGTRLCRRPRGASHRISRFHSPSARNSCGPTDRISSEPTRGSSRQLTKRMSNRWMASVRSLSHSTKLAPTGTTGRTRTNLSHLPGPLRAEDRAARHQRPGILSDSKSTSSLPTKSRAGLGPTVWLAGWVSLPAGDGIFLLWRRRAPTHAVP